MTITELINKLNNLLNKYGDSEIYQTDEDEFKEILDYNPISFVYAWKYDIKNGLPEKFYLMNNYTNTEVNDNN